MVILQERTEWSRPKARRGPDLSPDEVKAVVKAALAFLAKRYRFLAKLAGVMGLKAATVIYAASKRGGVTAGAALRAARAAAVTLEDILMARCPNPRACPHCGRDA
jgi:hypothetical protein